MTTTELLNRVSEIRLKHELIAELTGENFNVFSILGLQSYENRTHSAFLRELLDPRGSHGMGDAFLKAFIRLLRAEFQKFSAFKLGNLVEELPLAAKVVTEQHIGYKSEDLSEGGRIDLVISPNAGGWKILIENKIYAGDQECQLVRYHNSDPSALLLYLTLEGSEASDYSVSNQATNQKLLALEHYIPISYRNHILAWLEDCAKEASSRPLVRETLVQYGHLIRTLTQQNSSNLMTQDITKTVLFSKESLLAYVEMTAAHNSIRDNMITSINAKLNLIAVAEGLRSQRNYVDLNTTEDQKILWTDSLLEENNLGIGVGIENGKWFYGFCSLGAPNAAPDSKLLCNLRSRLAEVNMLGDLDQPTEFWPASRWWPDIPPNWLRDLKMIGEFYFEKTTTDDLDTCNTTTGFVGQVAILAREMKRIAREVFAVS